MDTSYYKGKEPFWGSWYIDKELGEGSFGKVFSIKRDDFGQTYKAALKVISFPNTITEIDSLKSEGMDDKSISQYYETFATELVKEFSLMSKLKGHSNIVSYEDHMTVRHEDGIGYDIFIRMELLTPLNSFLKSNTISERDIIRLGIDICKALEICSKYNIIHRDIKPENVFVSDLGTYKLGDFGVSRIAENATQGMSVKGTVSYMAPEVYKGQPYNHTVDIYSLGVMLYKLSNNHRGPFLPPAPEMIKYSDRERAENLRMNGTMFPDAVNASPQFMSIIRKAAEYKHEDRYSSATEMREELEALLFADKYERSKEITSRLAERKSAASGNVEASVNASDAYSEETVSAISVYAVPDETVSPVKAKAEKSVSEDNSLQNNSADEIKSSIQEEPDISKFDAENSMPVDIGTNSIADADAYKPDTHENTGKNVNNKMPVIIASIAGILVLIIIGVVVAVNASNRTYEEPDYSFLYEMAASSDSSDSSGAETNSVSSSDSASTVDRETSMSNKYYSIEGDVLVAYDAAWTTRYDVILDYLNTKNIQYGWNDDGKFLWIGIDNDTKLVFIFFAAGGDDTYWAYYISYCDTIIDYYDACAKFKRRFKDCGSADGAYFYSDDRPEIDRVVYYTIYADKDGDDKYIRQDAQCHYR